jgi:hypothetical protein
VPEKGFPFIEEDKLGHTFEKRGFPYVRSAGEVGVIPATGGASNGDDVSSIETERQVYVMSPSVWRNDGKPLNRK